jgi:hypothetical protein
MAHAVFHLSVAILGLLLIVAALRKLPPNPAGWIGRGPRVLVLAGLVVLYGGQIVEAIGAFGYRGNVRVSALATIHDVAAVVSPAGMLIVILGAVLTTSVILLARFNKLHSRWTPVVFVGAPVALALFVAGAIIFEY